MTNTTIADHGCRQRKWPPSAPHEALRPAPTHWMDGQHPPEHPNIILGGVEGVYGPQNTLMVWQYALLEQRNALRAIHTLNNPKIIPSCLGGYHPSIQCVDAVRKASCRALGGHFCWQRPWLWRLWCQLCFVLRLLNKWIGLTYALGP